MELTGEIPDYVCSGLYYLRWDENHVSGIFLFCYREP